MENFVTSVALIGVVIVVASLLSGVIERSGFPESRVECWRSLITQSERYPHSLAGGCLSASKQWGDFIQCVGGALFDWLTE